MANNHNTNGINQRLAEKIEKAQTLIRIFDERIPYDDTTSNMILAQEATLQTLLQIYGLSQKDAIELTGNLRSYFATTQEQTEAKQTIKEIVAHLRGELYTPTETHNMIKTLRVTA